MSRMHGWCSTRSTCGRTPGAPMAVTICATICAGCAPDVSTTSMPAERQPLLVWFVCASMCYTRKILRNCQYMKPLLLAKEQHPASPPCCARTRVGVFAPM